MSNSVQIGHDLPDLFKSFFATPQDEISDFKRPGGFTGKAVSPYYLVKRLTARFGMFGEGWGIEKAEHEFVHVTNGEILAFVTLSMWYISGSNKRIAGPHAGGDVVVKIDKEGKLRIDDEALKKAYTDAFSKCCSWLGLGGDVHDGMRDNKYSADKPWDVNTKESLAASKRLDSNKAGKTPAGDDGTSQEGAEADLAPIRKDVWTDDDRQILDELLHTMENLCAWIQEPEKYLPFESNVLAKVKEDPPSKVLPWLRIVVASAETKAKEKMAQPPIDDIPFPEE